MPAQFNGKPTRFNNVASWSPCYSERKNLNLFVFRQLEADLLTTSKDNSILVLFCSFKVSKYFQSTENAKIPQETWALV